MCEGAWSSQDKRLISNQACHKKVLQGYLFERVWKKKYKDALSGNIWHVLASVRYKEKPGAMPKVPLIGYSD